VIVSDNVDVGGDEGYWLRVIQVPSIEEEGRNGGRKSRLKVTSRKSESKTDTLDPEERTRLCSTTKIHYHNHNHNHSRTEDDSREKKSNRDRIINADSWITKCWMQQQRLLL